MAQSDRFSRIISFASVSILGFVIAFALGAYAYRTNLPPIPQIKAVLAEDGVTIPPLMFHVQPNRGMGAGVTKNTIGDDGALVMLTGFFEGENQVRLVRRDGSVAHKWSLDYFEHFPDSRNRACELQSSLHVDVHGTLVRPNGDLVFNYEYCGAVKLDQCGDVQWTVPQKAHHSIIEAAAGGYWLLGRYEWQSGNFPDRFPPFTTPESNKTIREDTLIRLNEEGDILEEVSIPELMRDAGLLPLLTADGRVFTLPRAGRYELVHSNKVTELSSDMADAFPLFETGDLAISMRQLNLVMVIDPDTKAVKWHQTGPWLRQHDPEFRPDGRISIFNNNAFSTAYKDKQVIQTTPLTTNIIVVDPVTGDTEVIFGEAPGEEMLSVVRGDHQVLSDGGVLITEFDSGRVLQVSADREIVWEFVNEYDETFVGEITNALVYPADYFTTQWETCQ